VPFRTGIAEEVGDTYVRAAGRPPALLGWFTPVDQRRGDHSGTFRRLLAHPGIYIFSMQSRGAILPRGGNVLHME
jgi:hypothetical protein